MTNLAHNLSNSASLEADRKAAFAYARELGRDKAYGDDALPKLGIRACEDAQKGILSPDDAKALYQDYITSVSKKAEHTDGGKAGNTSKLANFLKLGVMQTVDGVAVLQDAVLEHQNMRAAKLKVKGAYLAYETIAKAQLASPNARLSLAEIRSLMEKDDADKTAKDHLKAAVKAMEKALAMPQDMSPDETRHAQDALSSATAALNMLENREARAAKMAELAALQAELGLAA
jgi:hypothetical protein